MIKMKQYQGAMIHSIKDWLFAFEFTSNNSRMTWTEKPVQGRRYVNTAIQDLMAW